MSDLRRPDVVTVAVVRADGGLTVMRVITTEYRPATPEEKAAGAGERVAVWTITPTREYIDAIITKHGWKGPQAPVSWRLVPNEFADETDRTFRNAWKDDGGNEPGVDMPKAREIHRAGLRRLRAPLLESLDNDYLRADEGGDNQEKKRIAQRKQALRDVTADPSIDLAATPEELKAAIPPILREG